MSRPRCLYCDKEIVTDTGRGRPRKYCNDDCSRRYRRLKHCAECGNPIWDNSTLCVQCSNAHMIFDKRYRQALLWNSILDLRAEGLLNYEIAAVLKRSATMIATSVTRMKRAGLKVPESVYDSAQWMDSWYKLRNARGDINRHC